VKFPKKLYIAAASPFHGEKDEAVAIYSFFGRNIYDSGSGKTKSESR